MSSLVWELQFWFPTECAYYSLDLSSALSSYCLPNILLPGREGARRGYAKGEWLVWPGDTGPEKPTLNWPCATSNTVGSSDKYRVRIFLFNKIFFLMFRPVEVIKCIYCLIIKLTVYSNKSIYYKLRLIWKQIWRINKKSDTYLWVWC